jgi:hypothetical protein
VRRDGGDDLDRVAGQHLPVDDGRGLGALVEADQQRQEGDDRPGLLVGQGQPVDRDEGDDRLGQAEGDPQHGVLGQERREEAGQRRDEHHPGAVGLLGQPGPLADAEGGQGGQPDSISPTQTLGSRPKMVTLLGPVQGLRQ